MKKAFLIIKIIFVLVLLAGIALLADLFIRPSAPAPTHPSFSENTPAPIVTEQASTTYYDLNLKYPESSSTSLPEIFNFVESQKSQFLSDVGQATATPASIAINFANGGQWSFYIDTHIATSSKTTSYILEVYDYEGGAHGQSTDYAFTYDNSTGALVPLSSVIVDASSTYATLSTLARSYFGKKFPNGEAFNLTEGTLPEPDTFSTWYLASSSIVFIFGQYTIGPYVLGIQEFPVATSSIPNLLTGNY